MENENVREHDTNSFKLVAFIGIFQSILALDASSVGISTTLFIISPLVFLVPYSLLMVLYFSAVHHDSKYMRRNFEWKPRWWFLIIAGLIPGVGAAPIIFYLINRRRHIAYSMAVYAGDGEQGTKRWRKQIPEGVEVDEENLDEIESRSRIDKEDIEINSYWFRVLLLSFVAYMGAIVVLIAGMWISLGGWGLLMIFIILISTPVIAISIYLDAKEVEESKLRWNPEIWRYLIPWYILPIVAAPSYIYDRYRHLGLN